jgi:hypothetical protein
MTLAPTIQQIDAEAMPAAATQCSATRGDARTFMRSLSDGIAAAAFFDPQHRSTLEVTNLEAEIEGLRAGQEKRPTT